MVTVSGCCDADAHHKIKSHTFILDLRPQLLFLSLLRWESFVGRASHHQVWLIGACKVGRQQGCRGPDRAGREARLMAQRYWKAVVGCLVRIQLRNYIGRGRDETVSQGCIGRTIMMLGGSRGEVRRIKVRHSRQRRKYIYECQDLA